MELDIRIPMTTADGRQFWETFEILQEKLDDISYLWKSFTDNDVLYPERKPQNYDSLSNTTYQACKDLYDLIFARYSNGNTDNITILPAITGSMQWSKSSCRLVKIAVNAVQYKLWEVKKKYNPCSDCTLGEMIFGRDIPWCLEQYKNTNELGTILSGDLSLLSETIFSLMYLLLLRFVEE